MGRIWGSFVSTAGQGISKILGRGGRWPFIVHAYVGEESYEKPLVVLATCAKPHSGSMKEILDRGQH